MEKISLSHLSQQMLPRVHAARFSCASVLTVQVLKTRTKKLPPVTSGKAPVDTVQFTQKSSWMEQVKLGQL